MRSEDARLKAEIANIFVEPIFKICRKPVLPNQLDIDAPFCNKFCEPKPIALVRPSHCAPSSSVMGSNGK